MGPTTLKTPTPSAQWLAALSPAPTMKTMEFYCEACETAMCGECRAGEHREHGTVLLRDVVEQHKAALQRQLEAVRGR